MKYILLVIICFLTIATIHAQFKALERSIALADSINLNSPREKIFIHYDKPYYRLNDTMWLRGYLLTAEENMPSDSTGIAYLEFINQQGDVAKRISTLCFNGTFFNNITLSGESFSQGTYLLRAYTNRMRNYGDSLFFESRFNIIDPNAEDWKITVKQVSFSKNRLALIAGFNALDKKALISKKVNVRLRSKKKNLFHGQMLTDYGGNIYLDTLISNPQNYKELVLEIEDKDRLSLQIPVKSGDEQDIDVQFLPEGGRFIAGKMQQLGFKALNLYGKGIDVKGVIKDSRGQTIIPFASVYKGMGIVAFKPLPNETYTAVLENGMVFKLPAPQSSGTTLQVINNPAEDSLALKIDATPDLTGKKFYFAATAKGITCVRGTITIQAKPYELHIPRKAFPSGIARFTLYNEDNIPVNERVSFVWHEDRLKLTLSTDKAAYQTKDSVMIKLKAVNKLNENIEGSFSIAVIDTSQVKVSVTRENLLSYMILSADLKGEIEEPYYYFNNPKPGATEALMLTQGWVSYTWNYNALKFPYEKEFTVTGKVTNIFNKPYKNSGVTLFGKYGKQSVFLLDTLTNNEGIFQFTKFPYFANDSVNFVIQAVNKRGKTFNVGIDLNEPTYPPYTPGRIITGTENILFDTLAKNFIERQAKVEEQIKRDGHFLKDVVVTTKIKIPRSKNLNEDGGSDQVIAEKTLAKTPKETLLNVLQKNIPGFHVGTLPKSSSCLYLVNSNIARFVIDGIDLDYYYSPSSTRPTEYVQFLEGYLKYFSAEDIVGVEVMNYPAHNTAYKTHYLSINEQIAANPVMRDYSFIEITTYAGNGPFSKKTPGMYLYRPLAPVFGKQFYSPRYTSPQQETIFADMRQTIYWNPEVLTDSTGEANISFYTSESKSNYLIVIQGTDYKGGLGILYKPLVVKDEKAVTLNKRISK